MHRFLSILDDVIYFNIFYKMMKFNIFYKMKIYFNLLKWSQFVSAWINLFLLFRIEILYSKERKRGERKKELEKYGINSISKQFQ